MLRFVRRAAFGRRQAFGILNCDVRTLSVVTVHCFVMLPVKMLILLYNITLQYNALRLTVKQPLIKKP